MTPTSVRSEVARLNATLLEQELALAVNGSVLKRYGGNVIVTWPTGFTAGALSDHVFGSLQEYRRLLAQGQYTVLLFDGALLQISFAFEGERLISHRFCYYPCPLALRIESIGGNFSDYFDAELSAELEQQNTDIYSEASLDTAFSLRLRGPLRFDFDPGNAAIGHSATHLHVLHEEVRWPIYGPMSIGHFVRLVFSRFYPSVDVTVLREWPVQHERRTVAPSEEMDLFIECRQRFA